MSETTSTSASNYVARIGETAGLVWHTLNDNGPLNLTQLVKRLGRPRDEVMQAIGWLAREDKLVFIDRGRARLVALREQAPG